MPRANETAEPTTGTTNQATQGDRPGPNGGAQESVRLRVEGMHCAGCVASVERALRHREGVRDAMVSLAGGSALVKGSALDAGELADAVRSAGFEASPVASRDAAAELARRLGGEDDAERKAWLRRVQAGLVLWLPLELAHWFGHGLGIDLTSGVGLGVALAAGTLAQVLIGWGFYASAWRALRRGGTNMDTLVSLGAAAAYLLSLAHAVMIFAGMGDRPIYFVEATGLLTLISTGHWLERRARGGATVALRELAAMQPTHATILADADDATGQRVPAGEVMPGDLVLVRTGERCPVDGTLESAASMDLAAVTGESVPADLDAGEEVPAGAVAVGSAALVRATTDGAGGTMARMVALVADALASKADAQRLADRVSSVFVPVVIVIAACTLAFWLVAPAAWGGGVSKAVVSAATVLVISCPCALGLATPLAVMVGVGAAGRRGVLVRSARSLERAAAVGVALLDKTGTITTGTPAVDPGTPDGVLARAAMLAARSGHPLSVAITEEASGRQLDFRPAERVHERAGRGLFASDAQGTRLALVGAATARALGVHADTPPGPASVLLEAEESGTAGEREDADADPEAGPWRLVGTVLFTETLREGARELVEGLRARGLRVELLTGDSAGPAGRLAERVGLPADAVHAASTPQDKADKARSRPALFVGDGINDAPAMAAAAAGGGLGVAVDAGSSVALEAADAVIPADRPAAVLDLVSIGRLTRRGIKQNLALAFVYNAMAIPAAAAGLLGEHGPIVAAAAMALSDLCVIGNAVRLRAVIDSRVGRASDEQAHGGDA